MSGNQSNTWLFYIDQPIALSLRKMPTTAASDSAVHSLSWVGRGDLRPMLARNVHIGERVVGFVHHHRELRVFLPQRVGDVAPFLARGLDALLSEDRLKRTPRSAAAALARHE